MTDFSMASRLCSECGMCCDGVMFETVKLQEGELAGVFGGLGLNVRRKRKKNYFAQPCSAYEGCSCKIYERRPERCRMFECRQLQGVKKGEVSEAAALEKIREAKERVRRVYLLFEQLGNRNAKRALKVRYEKVLEEPTGDFSSGETLRLRAELVREVAGLEELLGREFRISEGGLGNEGTE